MSENCPNCGQKKVSVEYWESELGWGRTCFATDEFDTLDMAEAAVEKYNDYQRSLDAKEGPGTPNYYCWAEISSK